VNLVSTVNWEKDPNLRAAARAARTGTGPCPSEAEIFAWVSDAVAPSTDEWSDHLARCPRCTAVARDALAFAAPWRPAKESNRRPRPLRSLLGWAAVLALLAGTPVLLRMLPRPVAGPGLADLPLQAAPFTPGSSGERWRGGQAEDADALLAAAMQPYARGEYRAAIQSLEEHLRRWPADGAARFYCGVALLLEDRAAEAARRLEEAAELEPELPPGEVEWYLGLAYLRSGQRDKAVAAFGTVEEVSSGRREAARDWRRKTLAGR